VGIRFEVEGTPAEVRLIGLSAGTDFELLWAAEPTEEIASWDRVLAASAPPGPASFTLPPRSDGHWLLWMTDLPLQPDGTYFVEVAEVRFDS
jgi:hypothetical protein